MSHPTASTPLLDIRNMDVAYGGIRAVRQLNLHVHPGERVALIGANGAGKSTTLRAICGLVPLAAGSIDYQGRSWYVPSYRFGVYKIWGLTAIMIVELMNLLYDDVNISLHTPPERFINI